MNFRDPTGLWSVNSSGGYSINDQVDIERFLNYYTSAVANDTWSADAGNSFIEWEMSTKYPGQSGPIYNSSGENYFLESAKVERNANGEFEWNQKSFERVTGMYQGYVDGNYNWKDWYSHPSIRKMHTAAKYGTYTGLGLQGAGYALMGTGAGAKPGGIMVKVGNILSVGSGILDASAYYLEGNYKAGNYVLGTTATFYGLAGFLKYGQKAANVPLASMASTYMFFNISGAVVNNGVIILERGK